jgi:hypothetical protein
MTNDWQALRDELARWHDAGRVPDFWWRDDDATARSSPLVRMLGLCRSAAIPLALAVIPQDVSAGLLEDDDALVTLLQHGVTHRNLAPAGDKKTEFPAVALPAEALDRLSQGRARMAGLFGPRALPVLVPPWNRVSSTGLVAALPGAGFCGLSRFGPRKRIDACAGLVQVNTHVDVIDWRGSRGFVGTQAALAQTLAHLQARRLANADPMEPTGLLTHHAVHDEATWVFIETFFAQTAGHGRAVWRKAPELFLQG